MTEGDAKVENLLRQSLGQEFNSLRYHEQVLAHSLVPKVSPGTRKIVCRVDLGLDVESIQKEWSDGEQFIDQFISDRSLHVVIFLREPAEAKGVPPSLDLHTYAVESRLFYFLSNALNKARLCEATAPWGGMPREKRDRIRSSVKKAVERQQPSSTAISQHIGLFTELAEELLSSTSLQSRFELVDELAAACQRHLSVRRCFWGELDVYRFVVTEIQCFFGSQRTHGLSAELKEKHSVADRLKYVLSLMKLLENALINSEGVIDRLRLLSCEAPSAFGDLLAALVADTVLPPQPLPLLAEAAKSDGQPKVSMADLVALKMTEQGLDSGSKWQVVEHAVRRSALIASMNQQWVEVPDHPRFGSQRYMVDTYRRKLVKSDVEPRKGLDMKSEPNVVPKQPFWRADWEVPTAPAKAGGFGLLNQITRTSVSIMYELEGLLTQAWWEPSLNNITVALMMDLLSPVPGFASAKLPIIVAEATCIIQENEVLEGEALAMVFKHLRVLYLASQQPVLGDIMRKTIGEDVRYLLGGSTNVDKIRGNGGSFRAECVTLLTDLCASVI